MKNIDVIKAFLDNTDEHTHANTEHVSYRGNKLWSYNTIIAEKMKGRTDRDILLINKTKYSVTTSKHQTMLNRELEFYTSKYQIVEVSIPVPYNSQSLYCI